LGREFFRVWVGQQWAQQPNTAASVTASPQAATSLPEHAEKW